jgi:DNA-binding transcriptional ArsR family regulator
VTTNHSAVLDAVGDPTRRAILEQLARRPMPVVELARLLPITRPAVSQHLKVLKDAELVTVRPDGTRRIYAVDQRGVAALSTWLEQLWDGALDAFKTEVEKKRT